MKYIQLIICSLMLLVSNGIQAQMPAGRTTSTIIADAMAQLPADTPEKYNRIMEDLITTGEEGLLNLIERMTPPGKQSNAVFEYAISGWTHFVANNNTARSTAASAFEKALREPIDKDIKAFILHQLRTIATDNNIEALRPFLLDEYLSDPAAQVLVSIKSDVAGKELLAALETSNTGVVKLNLVNAIGEMGYSQAEPILLKMMTQSQDTAMRKVLLHALGNVGSIQSLKILRESAQRDGYSYHKESATTSYILLLKRLNNSKPKMVKKEAEKLLSEAKKGNKPEIKIAATKLLLAQPSAKGDVMLKNAIKEGDISYLSAILNLYPYPDKSKSNNTKIAALIQKELASAKSPDVQTALIYWLGNHDVKAAVPLIADITATSNNPQILKAAAFSLAKLGGEESLSTLGSLLKSNNEETVMLAKEALSSYNGDISYTLASSFDKSGDAGKKAVLELIAQRRMESQYSLVYNQLFDDNDIVKTAAASTLKNIVTENNLSDLFTLLERLEAKHTSSIQAAINVALSNITPNKQLQLVADKMKNSSKKHLYYPALANSGSMEAMKVITQAYASATGVEKESAFDALTQWNSFQVIYPILEIGRNSKDNKEVEKVTRALVSIINKSAQPPAVKYLYLREAMQFAQNDKQRNEILKLIGNTGQYQAMLFAASYMDSDALKEAAAVAVMNIAINNPSFAGEETAKVLDKASKTLSNPDADYQRQSITKYLAENPQKGGFVSLFNGKNLDGWKGLVENPIKRARMTSRELAAAQVKADKEAFNDWKIEEGNIVFDGKGYNNLCTKEQYGDFEMLVDWKLYPGPEPDAGIYLRGTPQVQIWDTARVDVGAQVGSGGLYNNQQNPSKPLKVADQKVGEWNTFRIKMIGERVSVWLNDELVTDNVILENYWDRNFPIFPLEQIELQAHGSKVAYRDIFIKEIPRPEPFKLSKEEEKEGFRILFDGTNLDQWTGNKRDYAVESGNIVLHPSNGSGGNLYTNEEFDNFIFRFEFMLTPGANNGLGIRTPLEGDAAYVGMELQILDNDAPIYEKLEEYQYHGSVYGVIPAKRGYLKPNGEWNYQEVIADGDHIKIILNGTTILDGNIRDASKAGTVDKKQHPGLLNKSGHIGFLGHGSKVQFKNIRIKELK